ncbi:MFS transporter [Microbacterium sp.]|uniref:MFS transporter n=1 Tax=Microbacterium sp. TaxID=51671 RepID=UPI002C414B0D|nr:MFS transporter [Microbacterium sp.]HWL76504.1 MFS transporter [Microbacterium sp.]
MSRPTSPRAGWRLPSTPAFVVISGALVMVFLASGTPVPLYNTFRVEDGITNSGLAITTVIYLATTALALLTTGRLSNHLGRRPVAFGAILFAIAGCLLMMNVHGLGVLITGRALQGIACGVASSALGSYVIDTAPPRPRWLPAVITSNAPPFAIPVGALISGELVEVGPAPRLLVFAVLAVVLAVFGLLLWACPETVKPHPGAMRSLRPRIHVPHGEGRLLFAAGAAFVATWSLSGFYQAFSPVLTVDYLGTSSALVIAVVFASIVILSPIGGVLTGRLRTARAVRLGLGAFVVATAAILLSLHAGAIVPFLIASLVASVAQGAANSGGMRAVLAHSRPQDRSGLLATIYLISYAGAAAPGLLAGRLANSMPVDQIALGYGALVLVASAAGIVAIRSSSAAPRR